MLVNGILTRATDEPLLGPWVSIVVFPERLGGAFLLSPLPHPMCILRTISTRALELVINFWLDANNGRTIDGLVVV